MEPVPEETTFTSNGVPIWYVERGNGAPVVLLHGFSIHAKRNWLDAGIWDSLAGEFRVIAPDLRGHGRSGRPHRSTAYGRELIEDVRRLLDHLEIASAHFVGYSTGAQIALSVVLEFPDRVRRAVLGGGGMLEVGGEEYEWYRTIPETLSDLGPEETIAECLFPGARFDHELRSVMNANDPSALSAFATGMLELAHAEAEMRGNRIPVLLLIGEDDPYREQADAALRVGSNMRMIVQPGRNHSTALRDPRFVSTISDFLRTA